MLQNIAYRYLNEDEECIRYSLVHNIFRPRRNELVNNCVHKCAGLFIFFFLFTFIDLKKHIRNFYFNCNGTNVGLLLVGIPVYVFESKFLVVYYIIKQ